MNLRPKHREGAEVFTDSLVDIMFFLLLFFIIVSTLANQNVINLTTPSSKETTNLPKAEIMLAVDGQRNYYVNNAPVPFADIKAVLQSELKSKESQSVLLYMDKSLTVQDVADVMQIGAELGIKFALSVNPSKQ